MKQHDSKFLALLCLVVGVGALLLWHHQRHVGVLDRRLLAQETKVGALESVLLVAYTDSTNRLLDSLDTALRNAEVQLRGISMLSLQHLASIQDLRQIIALNRRGELYHPDPPQDRSWGPRAHQEPREDP